MCPMRSRKTPKGGRARDRIGLACITLLASASPLLAGARASDGRVSIQVLDDRLQAVALADVRLKTDRGLMRTRTQEAGQTEWLPFEVGQPLDLILEETQTSGGVTLGLIEELEPPPDSYGNPRTFLWEISRTQPLATPLTLEGDPERSVNHFPSDGAFPHWVIVVPAGFSDSLSMSVAPLLDKVVANQYLAYRGWTEAEDCLAGVVLICPPLELGQEGILIGVHTAEAPEAGEVAVDAYQFVDGFPEDSQLAGPGLEVMGLRDGVVFVRLFGELRAGHLALLVRPGASDSGRVQVLPDSSPEERANSNSRGAGRSGQRNPSPRVACEPETPLAPLGWSCGGASAQEVVQGEEAAIQHSTLYTGSPIYEEEVGASLTLRRVLDSSWNSVLVFAGSTWAAAESAESGGESEFRRRQLESYSQTLAFREGKHRRGQCKQAFRGVLLGREESTITRQRVSWSRGSGGFFELDSTPEQARILRICTDYIQTESACDRRR